MKDSESPLIGISEEDVTLLGIFIDYELKIKDKNKYYGKHYKYLMEGRTASPYETLYKDLTTHWGLRKQNV
ncbi:MAG: hypothetical protein D4S01_05140 [Dehalococcoidia bacterium]|nr:MAG: hypothetical protein D4S01_05140 [Dehalococcoidia bacterium]